MPSTIDTQMEVFCDFESERLAQFNAKFEEFTATLSAEERDYLNFIRRAADVAALEHGTALIDDAETFEEQIQAALGDTYVTYEEPQMASFVIRTTVITRCATWLLRC